MVRIAVLDSGCRIDSVGAQNTTRVFACSWESKSQLKTHFAHKAFVCQEDPHPCDPYGHGTGVHLCINHIVQGIEIDHFTVLNPHGVGDPELLCATLDYVLSLKRYQVVNMSLGLENPHWVLPLVKAMKRAYESNTAVVAAANNLGALPYPAQLTYPLGCKAIHSEDVESLVWYPNSVVEFGARGVHIPLPLGHGGAVQWVSGSSFAAAHLTGICAKVLKAQGALSPLQLKTRLIELSLAQ